MKFITKLRIIAALIIGMIAGYFFIEKQRNKYIPEIGIASTAGKYITVYIEPNKKSYKIWKLNHKNWPIKILNLNDKWAEVIDYYGTKGWVEKRNLAKPYALIIEDTYCFKNEKTMQANQAAGKLMKGIFLELMMKNKQPNCNNTYCVLKYKNKAYLVNKTHLWIG